MPWWGWLIVGVGLLGVEMFVIDAQFYLVFLGVSAIVVGFLGLSGVIMPDWMQWLVFAALAIVAMLSFRRRLYALVRKSDGYVHERLTVGEHVRVPVRLEPGQTCRVEYRGTTWSTRNIGAHPIEAGAEAAIVQIEELTLKVTA